MGSTNILITTSIFTARKEFILESDEGFHDGIGGARGSHVELNSEGSKNILMLNGVAEYC